VREVNDRLNRSLVITALSWGSILPEKQVSWVIEHRVFHYLFFWFIEVPTMMLIFFLLLLPKGRWIPKFLFQAPRPLRGFLFFWTLIGWVALTRLGSPKEKDGKVILQWSSKK